MKTQIEKEQERDEVLAALSVVRKEAIELASEIAMDVYKIKGRVTSTEVFEEIERKGLLSKIESIDRRFMGAVFGKGRGWKRTGFEETGSHARPVSIWER